MSAMKAYTTMYMIFVYIFLFNYIFKDLKMNNDEMSLSLLLTDIKFESEKLSNGIHNFSSAVKVVM